jgi:hypothetical protein
VAEKIRAGDCVIHKPSREEWWVWGVDSSVEPALVLNFGWPNELTPIHDFELVPGSNRPLDRAQRQRRRQFGRRFDDDREEEAADNARMDLEWAL